MSNKGCVDYRKSVPRLLSKWPTIPIEIVPTSAPRVLFTLKALGSPAPFLRLGGKAKAGPIVTDNNNFIIDAPFPPLLLDQDVAQGKKDNWTPIALAERLNTIVGVVEVGIFAGITGPQSEALGPQGGGGQKPIAAYFGLEDGGVQIRSMVTAEDGTITYSVANA
jgi:ribose 5-phosphate isomerase A